MQPSAAPVPKEQAEQATSGDQPVEEAAGRQRSDTVHHTDSPRNHGKSARALEADLNEHGFEVSAHSLLTGTYQLLVTGGVSTCRPAPCQGPQGDDAPPPASSLGPRMASTASRPASANKHTTREEAQILKPLNSELFVHQALEQIYATLLSEVTYLLGALHVLAAALCEAGGRAPPTGTLSS